MEENREDLLVKPIDFDIAKRAIEERTNKKVFEIE